MKALIALFKSGEIRQFKKNTILFSPRKHNENVYYIKEGYIFAYEKNDVGGKKILYILEPNNIFPLATEIRNTKTKIYLEALTEVTVVILHKEIFFKKVYAKKETLKEIIAILSDYLLVYAERVSNLELETTTQKIAERLLHFDSRFGTQTGKHSILSIPLTHAFIANSINVARENVTRELGKLQKGKIISYKNSQLIILDKNTLKEKLTKPGSSK